MYFMKKLQILLSLVVLLVVASSCGLMKFVDEISPIGEESKTFDAKNFDKLEMGSALNVKVLKGTSFKVIATGDPNDLKDLKVDVSNGTLKVGYRRNAWLNISRYRMKIDIEMPTLSEVDFSGAAVIDIDSLGTLNNLKIKLSGASNLKINTAVKSLTVDLSGASKAKTYKKVDNFVLQCSGASIVDAFDSNIKTADLDLSGASKVDLAVSDFLKVKASGASFVKYKGDPKIEQDLSGSSKVTKL